MTKVANFVPGVPGLCRVLCRGFHSCAGCAGCSYVCARVCKKQNTAATKHTAFTHTYTPRHTRHTRHIVDSYHYFLRVSGTHSGTPDTPTTLIQKMTEMQKRVIRCTPENAKEMAAVVKAWPELHSLVQSLQAQNLFPGLRNLQITMTGNADQVAKGLGALLPPNATEPVLSQTTQKDGK